MDRIINTALLTISMYLWAYKKYGILALATKKVAQHAAVGRAKRTWFGPVRSHRQLTMSATDLIASLRAERERLTSAAIGNGVAAFAIAYDRPGRHSGYAMTA